MCIITLTTDLGLKDHYVAALKGQLLRQVASCTIVDISHQVQPFDIGEAAYYINNVAADFPEGTIHYLGVDQLPYLPIARPQDAIHPLVMQLQGQFFVGCDNGIFSLIRRYEEAEDIVRLDGLHTPDSLRAPARHIYLPAIAALASGKPLRTLGEPQASVRRAFTVQPTVNPQLIKGVVIHHDKYGNVIVNIDKVLFEKVGAGHPFTIYFKDSRYFIERLSSSYSDVPQGEKLALFNEDGFLEIAINKGVIDNGGGAATLLGLRIKDTVRVEFHPKGSAPTIEALFPKA